MARSRGERGPDRRPHEAEWVVVLGLGRFGTSLAEELVARGTEVLALDSDPAVIQRVSSALTHAAVVDTTDPDALRQLDVHHVDRAVVAIGSDLEASVLTTAALADFGIGDIWAKATSRAHARILERIGAHHVVLPEFDMGERTAHLVTGRMLDYIEFDADFAMVRTRVPRDLVGRSLSETALRRRHGITVVAIKHRGGEFAYTHQDTVLAEGDQLIASGRVGDVERFAERC